MKHLQHTSETLEIYACNMLGALTNSIIASMGSLGLGGGGAKSSTDLAPHELLPLPGRKEPQGQREVRHDLDALAVSDRRRSDEEDAGARAGDEGRGGRKA
jgi:hypothetical protein